MKILLSWSGSVSAQVAEALRDWLPLVIQYARPWMSRADLEAGVRWGQVLSKELEETDFGILCLSAQNLTAPWLHFEAGAISKKLSTSRVIPLLHGVEISALPGPLQQFQAFATDEQGLTRTIDAIYSHLPTASMPISADNLRRTFAKWWPDLKSRLDAIALDAPAAAQAFDQTDALKEVLLIARSLSRASPVPSSPRGFSDSFMVTSHPKPASSASITLYSGDNSLTFVDADASMAEFIDGYCALHNIDRCDISNHFDKMYVKLRSTDLWKELRSQNLSPSSALRTIGKRIEKWAGGLQ